MTGLANDNLLTLALLTFNQERYVREAVRSVFAQNYSPLQIVISDDASTDDTFRIVEDEARKYSGPHRVRLNRNPKNLGVGEHVNLVASLADSNFIVVASGDDISGPERVSALARAYREARTKYFYISSNATMLDKNGHTAGELVIRGHPPDDLRRLVRGSAMPLGATEAFTKGLLEYFGELHGNLVNEDFVLPLRAHLLGRVRYLNMPLVQYRTGAGSLSQADERLARRDLLARRAKYLAQQQIAVASMLSDLCFFDSHAQLNSDYARIPGLKRELCRRLRILAAIESFCHYRSQGRRFKGVFELIRVPHSLVTLVLDKVRSVFRSKA